MTDSFEVSATLPVSQKDLYHAWINSKQHGEFTGSKAIINPKIGGNFSAWDGYIQGKTTVLEPFSRIVQSWRTTDFSETSEDSILEILFQPKGKNTKITLRHFKIPEGKGGEYKKGWKDFYFAPMKIYFKKSK